MNEQLNCNLKNLVKPGICIAVTKGCGYLEYSKTIIVTHFLEWMRLFHASGENQSQVLQVPTKTTLLFPGLCDGSTGKLPSMFKSVKEIIIHSVKNVKWLSLGSSNVSFQFPSLFLMCTLSQNLIWFFEVTQSEIRNYMSPSPWFENMSHVKVTVIVAFLDSFIAKVLGICARALYSWLLKNMAVTGANFQKFNY